MLIAAQKHELINGELKLRMARACTERLDETKWSETRDETPRPFGPRPRRDPRRAQFRLDRDKTETLSILSETSPRQDVRTSGDGLKCIRYRQKYATWVKKNEAPNTCPYFSQALSDFDRFHSVKSENV